MSFLFGGIAQLVERQLCKLEVRGSNPLASNLRSRRRAERGLSRRSLGEDGLFSPCGCKRSELRLGKPRNVLCLHSSERRKQKRFYAGLTSDLCKRLQSHNAGRVPHTAKWKPWDLKIYVAFVLQSSNPYLKSSSGRAFIKKRL